MTAFTASISRWVDCCAIYSPDCNAAQHRLGGRAGSALVLGQILVVFLHRTQVAARAAAGQVATGRVVAGGQRDFLPAHQARARGVRQLTGLRVGLLHRLGAGEEFSLIGLVVCRVGGSAGGTRATGSRGGSGGLGPADEAPPLRDGGALLVVLAEIPAVGIPGRLQRPDDGDLIRVIKL